MAPVVLSANTGAFNAALASLAGFAKSRPEIVPGVARLIEAPDKLFEFETRTTVAGKVAMFLQPSPRLRDLIAALEAGQSYELLLEHGHLPGHGEAAACQSERLSCWCPA